MDVATVVIDIRLKGAKDVGAGVGDVGKQSRATGEQVDGLRGRLTRLFTEIKEKGQTIAGHANMDGLIGKVMSLAAAYVSLRTVMDFVRAGFNFSAEMETSRIGIASVITATSDLVDQQGRILQGQEAYNAALGISDQIMNRVRIMGLETTATTGELVAGFQSMIAPATAVGMTMEQTQDFTLNMVKALGAMGIPLNQLSAEGRSLLDGTIIPTQDRLAIALGITGDMVKNWKAQGTHVQELQKRLEPFALAGQDVANTWAGLSSNMKDALGVLSGFTGSGFFTSVKAAYKDILDSIVDVKNAKPGEDIANIANAVKTLQDYLGGLVQGAASSFISWLQEMNKPENLSVLEQRVKGIWEGLEAAANHAAVAVDCIGSVFGASIDGWNSMPDAIKEMGIVGALLFGTKVKLALLGVGAVMTGFSEVKTFVENAIGEQEPEQTPQQQARQQEWHNWGKGEEYATSEKSHANHLNVLGQQDAQYAKESVTITQSALGDMAKAQDLYKNSMKQSSQERIVAIKAEFSTAIEANQKAIAARQRVAQSALMGASTPAERQTIEAEAANSIAVFQSNITALTQEQNRQITAITSKTTAEMRQVTKAAEEVSRDITKLEGELLALNAATREDGTVDKQALGVLKAKAQAQQEFKAACSKGVSEELAAKRMALQVALAEKKQIEENTQVQQQFYSQFGQMFKDRTDLALRALEKEEQAFRDAGVAEVDLERWKQRRLLEIRQDAAAGVERALQKYTEEANNQAAQMEQITTKLTSGMENSLTSAFVSSIEKGKINLNSFKSFFSSFLSDLIRMAVAKPITVKIAGAVSGALGLGGNGTAQAGAGGAGGGVGGTGLGVGDALSLANAGGGGGWFTEGLNSAASWLMPNTFAPNASNAVITGVASPAQVIANIQAGGSGQALLPGAQGIPTNTFSSSLGQVVNPWSIGGGIIGGIGASMITPELFKGANPQAVSTGTSIGSGVGGALGTAGMAIAVANGWNPIGWAMGGISLLSTLFGGVAGGGLGALFGGYKDDPGLWTATNLDLTRGTSGADMEALAKDKKHPWAWYTHKDDDGYLVQSRNRHGMKKEAAEQATAYMEEVAQQALGLSDKVVEGMGGINASLGTAYKQSLESFKWTRVAADWEDEEPKLEDLGKQLLKNTQDNIYNALMGTDMSSLMKADDGAIADTADEIVGTVMDAISVLALGAAFEDKGAEYVNKMGKKLADGYSGTGINISDYLSVDLNNLTTGMVESLAAAVTAINGMQAGIKQIQSPLSAVEQQAEAAKKQLDEYAKALEKSGLNQKWAAGVIEDYRKAVVDDYIKKLNESIHPASALSTTMKNVNDSVTQTITAMKMMAATSEELAQIESQRAEILQRAYDDATREYNQDYATRYATVTGGDKDSVAAQIARENELRAIEEKYGRGVDWSKTYEHKIANLNAEKYQGRSDWNEASLDKAIADEGMTKGEWYSRYGRAEGVIAPTGNDDNYIYTLLQKAALLNAERYQGRTNWDVESVDKAIAEAGLTRESWYEMYGKAEGLEGPTDYYAQTEALQKAEEARRALDALQAQQNKYLQEQVQLSQKLVNSWQGVVDALNDTRAALHRENTDPARGFAAAQAEFDELYAKALGGDSDAAAKMGQIGSELLAMGKKNSADQYIYQQLFNDIDKKLFDTGIYAAKEYDAAQVQLDIMNKQLGVQESTKDLTAEILKAQNELNAALAGLAAPKPPTQGGGQSTGGQAWERSVLQAKAAQLNMEKFQGHSNWSSGAVEKVIAEAGLTFETWWKMYGQHEGLDIKGFATGGVTPANTPFWVGERGPELVMSPQQYGVLSNADSLNMLARVSAASYADDYAAPYAKGFGTSRMITSPTNMAMLTRMPAASDGGATAALHAALNEMRDEIKSLRQDNKNLLGQVVKHTKGVLDEAVEVRSTGMPTREYKAPPMHVINFPE